MLEKRDKKTTLRAWLLYVCNFRHPVFVVGCCQACSDMHFKPFGTPCVCFLEHPASKIQKAKAKGRRYQFRSVILRPVSFGIEHPVIFSRSHIFELGFLCPVLFRYSGPRHCFLGAWTALPFAVGMLTPAGMCLQIFKSYMAACFGTRGLSSTGDHLGAVPNKDSFVSTIVS